MARLSDKVVIASLGKSERRALLARSDAAGLKQFGLHFGLVLLVGALIVARPPFWPALLVVQGILLIFLFTALHESIHLTAFKTPGYNHIVASISGFLVFTPPQWFRLFHFAHHRFTHDPDHDPELVPPKSKTYWGYLSYLSGLPVWVSLARGLLTNALGRNADPFVGDKARPKVRREALWFLALYATTAGASLVWASDLLFWTWWLPVLLGQPFLRGYLLAEHTGCPHVGDMLANSRTTFSNPLVRFIAWNMPYHAEHHAMPAVPFYKLPDLHRHTAAHLGVTAPGYVSFHAGHLKGLRTSV